MGILLYLLATILSFFLNIFFVIYDIIRLHNYKEINRYCLDIAIGKDQLGNITASLFFNDILIKKDGIRFGNPDLTISGILGENKIRGKLKPMGILLSWVLDKIEPNHVEKSIGK